MTERDRPRLAVLLVLVLSVAGCTVPLHNTYKLIVSSAGHGTVDPSGSLVLDYGTDIHIRAIADSGYHFKSWEVTSGSATIADTTLSDTRVSLRGDSVLFYGTIYYASVEALFAVGPAAPFITGATVAGNSVTITWDTVAGASSYNLYWAAGSKVTPSTGTLVASAVSPQTVSGLTTGTQYSFIVTALEGTLESSPSNTVSVTP